LVFDIDFSKKKILPLRKNEVMSEEAPKSSNKILGPFEKIVLIGSLVLLAYLAFQRGGFKVSEKTEDVEIIDNPHSQNWKQKKRKYDTKEESSAVDAVLAELAEQYSKGEKVQPKNADLSNDEAEYLDDMQAKYKLDEQVKNAKDWFAVLKASHSTYNKVKSLFDDANPTSDKPARSGGGAENIEEVLKDKEKASEVYYKLQDYFGISKEDISAFAKSGKKAVSDWAEFVEEKKKE